MLTLPSRPGPTLRALGIIAALPAFVSSAPPPASCGLAGQTNGTTITYSFAGTLVEPFGTLAAGAAFTGSFSYAASQPDLSPTLPNRGDYLYQSISVTFGNTTVTDNGTGVIHVYEGPGGYPTDLFHLHPYNVVGSLGGLTLAPGAGLQLVLQNVDGTAWTSTALPDETLTMSDLTPSFAATFIELHGTAAPGTLMPMARGELGACCSTPPATAAQTLINTITAMGLPQGVTNSLTAALGGTPNCGKAGAFINQVNAKLQSGQLTPAQATVLLLAANSIKTCMGCP